MNISRFPILYITKMRLNPRICHQTTIRKRAVEQKKQLQFNQRFQGNNRPTGTLQVLIETVATPWSSEILSFPPIHERPKSRISYGFSLNDTEVVETDRKLNPSMPPDQRRFRVQIPRLNLSQVSSYQSPFRRTGNADIN